MVAPDLTRKRHSRDLAVRGAGIVQDRVVAEPRRREIAVHDPRLQQIAAKRLRLDSAVSRGSNSSATSRSKALPLVFAAPHESR